MTLSMMILSIMTQHNDTQHDDTQHNDTQNDDNQLNNMKTQHNVGILNVMVPPKLSCLPPIYDINDCKQKSCTRKNFLMQPPYFSTTVNYRRKTSRTK